MDRSQRQRILIVDDNPDIRESLKRVLEAADYEVEIAADGRQALRMQRAHPADAIITDIFMPDMDGVETITQIRTKFPATRIITISGGAETHKGEYVPIALKAAGADASLRKPFDPKDLLTALQELLGKAAARL